MNNETENKDEKVDSDITHNDIPHIESLSNKQKDLHFHLLYSVENFSRYCQKNIPTIYIQKI